MKIKKVYITAPSEYFSGGPESLHQLAFVLRNYFNVDAEMLYLPTKVNPVHPRLRNYNIPYVSHILDSEDTLVVSTELIEHINFVEKNFPTALKAIWWLSVDFHYISLFCRYATLLDKLVLKKQLYSAKYLNQYCLANPTFASLAKSWGEVNYHLFEQDFSKFNFHFAQSHYAFNFLLGMGLKNIFHIRDFLVDSGISSNSCAKNNRTISYNPAKGEAALRIVKKKLPDFTFIPVSGSSRDEVNKILQTSIAYLDLGFHPGRDRLPREAAACDCLVFTSTLGSAGNPIDIPIPTTYKFNLDSDTASVIASSIQESCNSYMNRLQDFEGYRSQIIHDQDSCINDVKKFLNHLSGG